MTPNGIELFSLRQRRSADGSVFFTGRIGVAFVVMIRDDVERDVWKAIACDPSQTNRDDRPSPARAIAPPADDGWYSDDSMNDDVDDEWLTSQQPQEGR